MSNNFATFLSPSSTDNTPISTACLMLEKLGSLLGLHFNGGKMCEKLGSPPGLHANRVRNAQEIRQFFGATCKLRRNERQNWGEMNNLIPKTWSPLPKLNWRSLNQKPSALNLLELHTLDSITLNHQLHTLDELFSIDDIYLALSHQLLTLDQLLSIDAPSHWIANS